MLLLLALSRAAAPPASTDLVDAATLVPGLQVALAYSTADNFLHRDVYGELETCRLQSDAAKMLATAAQALQTTRPDLHLLALDCARPYHVQQEMWKLVVGTPQQGYVADPASGSIHNFGCAIDLTLANAEGPLDMGTPFDFFGDAAQPRQERALLLSGRLTGTQVANRLVLREAMLRAGFLPLDNEWWHFDCATGSEARKRYARIP
jgi:D-alanyl-D-alanine dipeptidase